MAVHVSEDLEMRPITMADARIVADLKNAQMKALLGVGTVTVEQLHSDWQSPDFDIEESSQLLLDVQGRTLGSVIVWNNAPVAVNPWVDLDTHPDRGDTAVGQQLLAWAEQRARQMISRAPENARVVMNVGALSVDTPRKRLLENNHMTHTRTFYTMRIDMAAPPPAPTWPEGIQVKRFDRDTDELPTIKAVEEAFKDHWGFVEEPLEESLKHWRHWMDTSEDYDPSLWFLAVDGDEVVGVSLCEPQSHEAPEAGYVGELGVRRPWRRRGVATALLRHSFCEFWKRGKRAITLGVDATSLTNATRLYKKVGMRVWREWLHYEKELRPGTDLTRQSLDD